MKFRACVGMNPKITWPSAIPGKPAIKELLYAGKGGAARNLLAAGNQQAMNDKRCQTTRYPGDRSGICVEETSGALSRSGRCLRRH